MISFCLYYLLRSHPQVVTLGIRASKNGFCPQCPAVAAIPQTSGAIMMVLITQIQTFLNPRGAGFLCRCVARASGLARARSHVPSVLRASTQLENHQAQTRSFSSERPNAESGGVYCPAGTRTQVSWFLVNAISHVSGFVAVPVLTPLLLVRTTGQLLLHILQRVPPP